MLRAGVVTFALVSAITVPLVAQGQDSQPPPYAEDAKAAWTLVAPAHLPVGYPSGFYIEQNPPGYPDGPYSTSFGPISVESAGPKPYSGAFKVLRVSCGQPPRSCHSLRER